MRSILSEFSLPKINHLGFCAPFERGFCWRVGEDHQRAWKRILGGEISNLQEPGTGRGFGI
jgi:hypothetical protein